MNKIQFLICVVIGLLNIPLIEGGWYITVSVVGFWGGVFFQMFEANERRKYLTEAIRAVIEHASTTDTLKE